MKLQLEELESRFCPAPLAGAILRLQSIANPVANLVAKGNLTIDIVPVSGPEYKHNFVLSGNEELNQVRDAVVADFSIFGFDASVLPTGSIKVASY
jgi:hypothetical protein